MVMQYLQNDVEKFVTNILGMNLPDTPTFDPKRLAFRISHLKEEVSEIQQALYSRDIELAADGLIDLTYIALGTLLEMGMPISTFKEVHRANMDKIQGSINKRPGGNGHDAVKPEGWKAPNLIPYMHITKNIVEQTFKLPEDFKILIIGHGRHGKDTVAEIISKLYGIKFKSSSWICAEHIIIYCLGPDYGYTTVEQCYKDRHNHRDQWFEILKDWSEDNGGTLADLIFKESAIYCGLRNKEELDIIKERKTYDVCLWVDRSQHLPPESMTSCTVTKNDADFIIDNNGTESQLVENVVNTLAKFSLKDI